MKRTRVLLEIRQMRFADLYEGWQVGRLSQQEPAEALGVRDRTFRRLQPAFLRRKVRLGCWAGAWGRCRRGSRR